MFLNSVRKPLIIDWTIYCNKWNTDILGADGSTLKILPALNKQHAKSKQGDLPFKSEVQ